MAWKNLNPDMTVDERSKFFSKQKFYYDCYEAISPKHTVSKKEKLQDLPGKACS